MKGPIGRVFLAATSLFVLAACAGDRPLSPEGTAPMMSVGTASTTLVCSFPDIDKAAKALFSSNRDPVFGLISTMKTAHRTDGLAGATNPGFDVLRSTESARGTGRIKSGANGGHADTFTKAVFGCTSHNVIPEDMSVVAAWNFGVYAVRGGVQDEGAAKSFANAPRFGAQTPTGSSWLATFNNSESRYLLWGYFLDANPFTGEPVTNAFQLNAHPDVTFGEDQLRVGLCVDPLSNTGQHRRLIHAASAGTLVGALSPVTFCSDPADFAALAQTTGFFASVRQALSLFQPQVAFAQSRGGVGSLETSLSPFGSIPLDGTTSTLQWAQEPITGTSRGTTQDPPIAVDYHTAVSGVAIAGIAMTATVADNNGVPGQISYVAVTDNNGRATFSDLTIDSPGIYTMTITASTGLSITSGTFHIRP